MKNVQIFLTATILLASEVTCQFGIVPAYSRHPGCTRNDTIEVARWYRFIETAKSSDQLKGYAGTVGIIGGGSEDVGGTYFAAATALKIGADRVVVFCYSTVAEAIKSKDSNILVYPILNTAVDRVITLLTNIDIIVLGPGLENDAHSMNAVIPKVINHCKAEKKPLIVDLDVYFLTPAVLNNFIKFPYPGVIFTPNAVEFDKMYEVFQKPGGMGDVKIDFDKFGGFIYFLRKGCSDVGVGLNSVATFALNKPMSHKRSHGQGHMLAGALATYYFRALKSLPIISETHGGPMIRAAVASYAAAKFVRKNSEDVFRTRGKSLITSDLIENIPSIVGDLYLSD